MSSPINDIALDQLFRTGRTRNGWTDKEVPETLIKAVYELTKMGATSMNTCPARFYFVHSAEAKARLKPYLMGSNAEKTMKAQYCVIIATDTLFYEKLPQLFPPMPDAKKMFDASNQFTADFGFRNSSLQGAYLMLAARSLGLDCGPMSGFDQAGVDKEFFEGDPETASWKSNFLCNIGYGSDENLFPRLPRLSFDEACKVA